MKYNREKHHRRSIRLKGYDYSDPGAYFVTMCTKDRECLFGSIKDHNVLLNDAGLMVKKWWAELEIKFKNIETGEYVIMPNHFHGIIHIVGADLCVCPCRARGCNTHAIKGVHTGAPLHRVVQWFKTMTTNEYLKNIYENKWQRINGKLWQRNYFEHVIRNEKELFRTREYIRFNPVQWDTDEENPVNIKKDDI